MVAEVVDAVVVIYLTGGRYFVIGSETVFYDKKRDAIAVVEVVQRQAQAERVDDPAPVGSLKIRVSGAAEEAVLIRVGLILCGDSAIGVIAEGYKVDGALAQDFAVVVCKRYDEAASLIFFEHVGWISAKNLNVDQSVVYPVLCLSLEHVLGTAGRGIDSARSHHAADFIGRIDLMTDFYRPGAGNQLVVSGSVGDLVVIFTFVEADTGAHEGKMVEDIDLIESQPVVDEAFVFGEEGCYKSFVKVDHPAAAPAAILFDEMNGAVKMCDGDQRLNVVLSALKKELAVKLDAFAVRFRFIAFGIDSCPCD